MSTWFGLVCVAAGVRHAAAGNSVVSECGAWRYRGSSSRKHKSFLLANLVQQVLDGRLRGVDGQESHAAQEKCSKQGDPGVPVSKCVATVGCHDVSTGCQDVPGC